MKNDKFISQYEISAHKRVVVKSNILSLYFHGSVIATLGMVAVVATIFLYGLQGAMLIATTIPPGFLVAAVVRSFAEKQSHLIIEHRTIRGLLDVLRKREPLSYWLGFIGSYIMTLCAYLASFLTSQGLDWKKIERVSLVGDIFLVWAVLAGWFGVTIAFSSWKILRSFPKTQRISSLLALKFLQEIDSRKN